MFTERLEARRLMSVAASAAAGTLYVYGDDYANGIRVVDAGADIAVKKWVSAGTYAEIYRVSDAKVDKVLIYGRGGADTIEVDFGVSANVVINGGHGADWIKAGGQDCVAWGDYDPTTASQADDNAADTLIAGSSGKCYLLGQGGNDKLHTGLYNMWLAVSGIDYLYGGPGNDHFYTKVGNSGRVADVQGNSGNDTLHGGPGRTVDFFGGSGVDHVDFSDFGKAVYLTMNGTRVSGSHVAASDRKYLIGSDVENATGTPFDDHIGGNGLHNQLHGGAGKDSLYGLTGNDTLFGGDHDDTLQGGLGDDSVFGQAGNDLLYSNGGTDILSGGSGNDKFACLDGRKTYVFGGIGTDTIWEKDGADIIEGVP